MIFSLMIFAGKTQMQLSTIPERTRSRMERNLEWRKAIWSATENAGSGTKEFATGIKIEIVFLLSSFSL